MLNEAVDALECQDGKIYVDIIHYSVSASLDKGVIVIKIKDDLGSEPYVTGDVSVKMMSGDVLISPCAADLTCKDNKDGTYTCVVKIIDNEYYYEKDVYQYYLVFEEGTGHNSVIKENGEWYAVYHGRDAIPDTRFDGDKRTARICKLDIKEGLIKAIR